VRYSLLAIAKFGCEVHWPILNYLFGLGWQDLMGCQMEDICFIPIELNG